MQTPERHETHSGDLPLCHLRGNADTMQLMRRCLRTPQHRMHLANKTMTGFMDWWLNRVRGEWITNEQYDRIYDRFLNAET